MQDFQSLNRVFLKNLKNWKSSKGIKKGFAGYVIVLIMTSFLFIITQSYIGLISQENEVSSVHGDIRRALYCADSGVQFTIAHLKKDPNLFVDSSKVFRIIHSTAGVASKTRQISDWIRIVSNSEGEGFFYAKSWNMASASFIKSQGKFIPRKIDGTLNYDSTILKQIWVRVKIATEPKGINIAQFGETVVQPTDPITAPPATGTFDSGWETDPFFTL